MKVDREGSSLYENSLSVEHDETHLAGFLRSPNSKNDKAIIISTSESYRY